MSNRFVDKGVENNSALERKNETLKFIEKTSFPIKEDRLKQAEVAEMFDVNTSLIRFW